MLTEQAVKEGREGGNWECEGEEEKVERKVEREGGKKIG